MITAPDRGRGARSSAWRFERSALVEVVVAGAVAFACSSSLSILTRGGFGMGDVKLGGMLGFLLGYQVLGALALGVVAGGVWSAGLLLTPPGRALRTAIAYGPFLALGGAVCDPLLEPASACLATASGVRTLVDETGRVVCEHCEVAATHARNGCAACSAERASSRARGC